MPPTVQQGAILLVKDVPDKDRNLKQRPVVVITATVDIKPNEPFEAIAITTQVPRPLPADHVRLPYQRQGQARTGLNKKNAAVCSWGVSVRHDQILDHKGACPTAILHAILKRINSLRGGGSTLS